VTDASSQDRFAAGLQAFHSFVSQDLLYAVKGLRKRVDLLGNDYYLAHIFRTLHWWTKPTHVTVLGDLVGSQWVNDNEFESRGRRYWNRMLVGTTRVEDELIDPSQGEREKIFSLDDATWTTRVINIAGNHDIGYAGDISETRLERFERVFGKANWDIRFEYPTAPNASVEATVTPSIHIIVLNSLLLDTPALSDKLQSDTIAYLNSVITGRSKPVEDTSSFTLLLTHLPLYKKAGVCIDPPFFDFWGSDDCGGICKPGGLKEQNHLSDAASGPGILESVFGMKGDANTPARGKGRQGLILTGHDHEGCDVWHFIPANSTYDSTSTEESTDRTQWESARWREADISSSHTGVREVTLRSMMGEFGGNAGLLSAWYNFDSGEWQYDIKMCRLGVQHIWWAVHIIDLVALALSVYRLAFGFTAPVSKILEKPRQVPKGK
jgi:hypothetical protein